MAVRHSKPRPPDQVTLASPLGRGLLIGWAGLVTLVSACILLGMNWEFRSSDGVPTPILATNIGQGVGLTAPATDISARPTALPTSIPSAPANVGAQPDSPQLNQDSTFGYGIQPYPVGDLDESMDRVSELGVGWVKVDADWPSIQPEVDQFNWAALDDFFRAAASRNLKVLVTVDGAPDWTRSVTARGKSGPPDNYQLYVSFVASVLDRYHGAVGAVEVWNSANLDTNWYSAGGLNPSSYLNLLIPTSQMIRSQDPNVLIVSGALTPTGRNDGLVGIDDFVYMEQLIKGGLLDYVDCVGVQHIGFNIPPTLTAEDAFSGGMPLGTFFAGPYDTSNPVNPHHSWSFNSTLNGYHNLIVASNHETSLCVTRFGWASAAGMGSVPEGYEYARDNTPEEQASFITKAFELMRRWGFVRLAIVANLDYALADEPTADNLYSLVGPDGRPRPAFIALRDLPKPP